MAAVKRYFTAEDPDVAEAWRKRLLQIVQPGATVLYQPSPPRSGWQRRRLRLLRPFRQLRRQLEAAWQAFKEARY